ncbi:hypothetical protein K1T71_003249 [Dendrolimus kikuchii]|uniref:Uncharacterized protein n=1 Tax=Dendrolimus kikuchii TaxID=765133 RepID=A0ACC1DBN8_9NEOP|nr:hypothetical protein K1T71_003249 [Dendrolimus kikuchii]
MTEKAEVKADALPDLDDLLQCPVCYEIPSGQIFQCNEGHHVCGRCKMRLDVCPVCRALFFGTRNYAMEELIANVRRLRAFKLGGKITTGSGSSENSTPARDTVSEEPENEAVQEEESNLQNSDQSLVRPPQACKGLFRCLCCKNGNGERLPSARLLNHLRYFHSPELIEGQSENGEYVQAWQFSTVPGRIVTAVRVSDMGIFFLIIEISNDSVRAWLSMAASPWVAHEFCYTVTVSGNDREAIFSDCVWSVRSCEGSLKKRGHCLSVTGLNAHALVAPASINGKLSVRRAAPDQQQLQPRAVLRVASRGNARDTNIHSVNHDDLYNIEPFLLDLSNDVARLSRAFATLGREANALRHSEAEAVSQIAETQSRWPQAAGERASANVEIVSQPPARNDGIDNTERLHLSRNARRRMRQRLRAALNEAPPVPPPAQGPRSAPARAPAPTPAVAFTGFAVVQQAPPAAPPGPSNGLPPTQTRNNRKKRRQRR